MANIRKEALMELTAAALRSAGATADAADSTARALVAADALRMGSHGVARAPYYCEHIRSGRVNGAAKANIRTHEGAAILVDADNGLAFPACDLAVARAIDGARALGVSWAAIVRSNHYGMAAHHLGPVAAAGMIGLTFSNAPAVMPAPGGKRALFGTNPIAAIFPRRDAAPIVIDLSLSEVAKGKLMVAAREGKPIPLGWATDADGNPTTDPNLGLKGFMLPAGGAKGAMLAMMVELLCAGLTGGGLSSEAPQFYDAASDAANLAQGFLVIDPARFAGRDAFLDRVETVVSLMLADEGVRLPGARRDKLAAQSEAEGMAIPDDLLAELNTLAGR
ncbi:MAG: Ldh family oxidoreductase [Betaproteobacteria bacterium]|nr:Ldh family oxidoreductase [Betaproteobacteria bacterium]